MAAVEQSTNNSTLQVPSPSASASATNSANPSRSPSIDGEAGGVVNAIPSTQERDPRQMSKEEFLEVRISEDCYDQDAWHDLLTDVQQEDDIQKVRRVFERFLKIYPSSARHWIQYAEFELKHQHFTEVESIFQQCLRSVLSVDLWKFYLNYIRRINTGPDSRAIISRAYEFVLQHIGLDRESGTIWGDYLFFLKTGQAANTWEEQQRMDAMRRIYQRAVSIPLNNIEHLWKDYDSFENGLNKLTAKKFLGEYNKGYMTARVVLKELRMHSDPIQKNVLPRPVKWTERELHQLELWKRYIAWEKSNPLHFEDKTALSARVVWTYKQALLTLRFYPEIWYEAANYFTEIGRTDEAVALLKNGTEVMPTSFLLNFAYAELQETRKLFKESRLIFETFIKNLAAKIEDLNEKVAADVKQEQERMAQEQLERPAPKQQHQHLARDLDEVDGEMRERDRDGSKKRARELQEYEKEARKEVDRWIQGAGLAWIMFMQFVRRTEGTTSWRQIFGRARRSNACPYQVYVAAALQEYYCTKDNSIAGKVFELGYKSFSDEPDFVLQYLEFLIQLNDDNNTRALFERALIAMSPEKSRKLWEKFSEYENKYGDMAAIAKVEKRRREVYPIDKVIDRFAERYSFDDLKVIEEMDLGASIRKNISVPEATDFTTEFPPLPEVDLDRAAIPGRRPLLEPVHPDLYPRPDFGMWSVQRFNPDAARRNATPAAGGVGMPVPQGGAVQGNGPIPRPSDLEPRALGGNPPHHLNLHHAGGDNMDSPMRDAEMRGLLGSVPPPQQQPQQQMPPAAMVPPSLPMGHLPGWTMTPVGMVPEALSFFLSKLPPAAMFNGPMLQPEDMMDLIRKAELPMMGGASGPGLPIPPPGQLPMPLPLQMQVPGQAQLAQLQGAMRGIGVPNQQQHQHQLQQQQHQQQPQQQQPIHRTDRDPRMRNANMMGGSGDRGGFKQRGGGDRGGRNGGGGGGGGGMKRKGRGGEYDDDMHFKRREYE